MARGLPQAQIAAEWQRLSKDWYSIYQWKRTARVGYTEWIAGWIASSIGEIRLIEDGLRARSFRAPDHRGQIDLNTDIGQLTEKRLVRAMFNAQELPLLGRVIDYEVPLKDNNSSEHGDIDLLCTQSGICLCVEAKSPRAGESVLKAVLQAYTYTLLASSAKELFLGSFGLDSDVRLTPAVLTFAVARSGRQLADEGDFPRLLDLIRLLNGKLDGVGVNSIRFFIVQNSAAELENCLTTTGPDGEKRAVFHDGFSLAIEERHLSI